MSDHLNWSRPSFALLPSCIDSLGDTCYCQEALKRVNFLSLTLVFALAVGWKTTSKLTWTKSLTITTWWAAPSSSATPSGTSTKGSTPAWPPTCTARWSASGPPSSLDVSEQTAKAFCLHDALHEHQQRSEICGGLCSVSCQHDGVKTTRTMTSLKQLSSLHWYQIQEMLELQLSGES